MKQLCFTGDYTRRFARVKEFSNEKVEIVPDEFLKRFCNHWLEEEFTVQSGAAKYQRNKTRKDKRSGHYTRRIITTRGVIPLNVPRGVDQKYEFALFDKFKRKTENFEDIVIDAILKGHSSRKASMFFKKMFGQGTISHQAAVSTLRKFDSELEVWKNRPIRDNVVVLVLDAVHLKGVVPHLKTANPVLFAYAVYPDGKEEVLDYELAMGESEAAWSRFCGKLWHRGLHNVELVVHDDRSGIINTVSMIWPKALDQQCVFHIMQNVTKYLKGCQDKRKILDDISLLYESGSEEEFYRRVGVLQKKWRMYRYSRAFKYLFKMIPDSIKYFNLPERYWSIAKTSNRLERLFEELKRRIKVFRRFPNKQSCRRWLYALLVERNKINMGCELLPNESQHSS